MDVVYKACLDPQDRRRAERLELLDELEEWTLIQQHYCITVAHKVVGGKGDQAGEEGAGASGLAGISLKRKLPPVPQFGRSTEPRRLPCGD